MNSGFSDTADCSRPPADPGTADGDARLRSMVLEENKSYQRYFQDQKEDIERIARLVKLPSGNRTQRATRTEWSCNGSTYVAWSGVDKSDLSIWRTCDQRGIEAVLVFPLNAFGRCTAEEAVVFGAGMRYAGIFLRKIAEESGVLLIFDMVRNTMLDFAIEGIHKGMVSMPHRSQLLALQENSEHRPCRVLCLHVEDSGAVHVANVFEDADRCFFYRLVPWADREGVLIIGKSVVAGKVCFIDFRDAAEGLPAVCSLPIQVGTEPCIVLACADRNGIFVALSASNGMSISRTVLPACPNPAAVCSLEQLASFEYCFPHAIALTAQHLLLIVNRGTSFLPVSVGRHNGKCKFALVPQHLRQFHFSLSHVAAGSDPYLRGQSLIDRPQTIRWHVQTGALTRSETAPIAACDRFTTFSIRFEASDGQEILLTAACRSDQLDHAGRPCAPMPTVLYVYGSYGRTAIPDYSATRLELIESGVLYAMVHVRGGGEFGPSWHEAGRGKNRLRAVLDFLEAAQWLSEAGYSNRLAAIGRSAGAAIVACAVNFFPHRFSAAVMEYPFLNVADALIEGQSALSEAEHEEWGGSEEHLRMICPMATMQSLPYPDMLLVGGMRDWRGPPAPVLSWITQIRCLTTRETRVLAHFGEEVGHGLYENGADHLARKLEVLRFLSERIGSKPADCAD